MYGSLMETRYASISMHFSSSMSKQLNGPSAVYLNHG